MKNSKLRKHWNIQKKLANRIALFFTDTNSNFDPGRLNDTIVTIGVEQRNINVPYSAQYTSVFPYPCYNYNGISYHD